MKRFGINIDAALGLSKPQIEQIARRVGKDHDLAQKLWSSGIPEARCLAALVDDPKQVTESQMEAWVRDFNSWDLCDGCCSSLFDKTPYAYKKAFEWSRRNEEFVKRAGFVMMAVLAVHDKKANDESFLQFMPVIRLESVDGRNYVRKAVNWALRQIGKRNPALNQAAIAVGEEIARIDSRSSRWIASDALRELRGEPVQRRLSRNFSAERSNSPES